MVIIIIDFNATYNASVDTMQSASSIYTNVSGSVPRKHYIKE